MRVSDWSADVCSSDLHRGTDASELDVVDRPAVATVELIARDVEANLRGLAGQRFAEVEHRGLQTVVAIDEGTVCEHLGATAVAVLGEARAEVGHFRPVGATIDADFKHAAVIAESDHGQRSEEHTSELQSLMR